MSLHRWRTVALTFSMVACSTQAHIALNDGSAMSGEIVGSDAEFLYVVDSRSARTPIRRSDVRDIDHPGNVSATLGTIATGTGVVGAIVGLGFEGAGVEGAAFFVGLPALGLVALGLAPMIWGFSTWSRSVCATEVDASAQDAARVQLSVEQYASLCAERATYLDASETIARRYGFASQASFAAEDEEWRATFARDPARRARFDEIYARWMAWLAQQR